MKKTLKTVALLAALVSSIAALILGYLYLEDITRSLKKMSGYISKLIKNN